jgi:hypothetical protein
MSDLEDHLSHLAVAKASLDDCVWVKRKALDVFEFSGGDRALTDEDVLAKRKLLVDMKASKAILLALDSMGRAGISTTAAAVPTTTSSSTAISPTSSSSMKSNDGHTEAMCILLKTLRNLARDSKESNYLVHELHAQDVIKNCLTHYELCLPIIRESLGVLTNLAAPSENRVMIYSATAKDICRQLMRSTNYVDLKLLHNGLACLINLGNEPSLAQDLNVLCLPCLIEIGMIQCKDVTCAEYVSTIIALLLQDLQTCSDILKRSPIILEMLINLLKLHSRQVKLVEEVLKSFTLLAIVQENKPVMLRFGVLNSFKLCFGNFSQNHVIAIWLLKALRNFAANHLEMKEILYDFGCTVWICDLIRIHGNTNLTVTKFGLFCLWSLSNLQKNKINLVFDDQVDLLIMNSLRLVGNDSLSITFIGLSTLTSLSQDVKTKKKMFKNGIVTSCLHSLKTFETSSSINEVSAALLWSLLLDYEISLEISKNDFFVLNSLLKTLEQFSTDKKICFKTLSAIECLCINKTGCANLIEAGAVPKVVGILKLHLHKNGENSEILCKCLNVLSSLAHLSDDVVTFQKLNLEETCIEIQRLYPLDDKLNRAAERLLTSMEGRTLMPT